MKRTVFLLAVAIQPMLTACETIMTNMPGVYKIDIEQGNMIDQAMVDQLRPNMTKRQVLYIMGSPMITDTFHERRWDYLYSDQPGGEARVQKRLSLYFDGDNLVGVQGDFHPSAMPVIKESTETTVDVPKRQLDSTMWEKITSLFETDTPSDNQTEPSSKETGEKPTGDQHKKPETDYEIGTSENPY